ncbi:Cys-Gln thioester bond-forming surface protein [Nocardiopsis algeriensis]|uniref:TQXA domain-containing protein n=1 Tax=Nocardiopsis algeriensis TaxID=1478215 RepID=A0A841INS0_9ACTN|nr:TQXA domain-containing protein [Nocardiopsis algeriensis]
MTHISSSRTFARAGLAATAAAFLAFGLAAPAAAEPVTEGSARGQYLDNAESGTRVSTTGGTIGTTLFNLRLEDGTVLTMYCIDFETSIRTGAWYLEDSWANYPGKGEFAAPAKVHWILQNAYPAVGAAELGTAAGVEGLSGKDALAATQAAIWHFSNDVDLKEQGNSEDVKAVYDWLVANAEELPQTEEPAPTLSITPESATGEAGGTVGSFTISTSAEDVPVDLSAPEGVELIDLATGEAVSSVGDGDKVGFSVPAEAEAGEASFSLETSATVQAGRLFKGEDSKPTQTLITAEGGTTTVEASASATWTAKPEEPSEEPSAPEEPSEEPSAPEEPSEEPSAPEEPSETPKPTPPADDKPSLPVTGGALAGLVGVGVAALGAGGAAIYLSRKRKSAGSDTEA